MTILAVLAGWAVGPPARADYVGLEVVIRDDLTICKDQTEPEIPFKLEVCDVYAVLNNAADRILSVGFGDISTTDTNGFFQHSLGDILAPSCSDLVPEPTLACDSFVTVGQSCDAGSSTTDPDFDGPLFNSGGEAAGGWYNADPGNGQGAPDANDRVLIGQFSYKQNRNASGTLTVFVELAGTEQSTEFALQTFDCSVPCIPGGGGSSSSIFDPVTAAAPVAPTCDGGGLDCVILQVPSPCTTIQAAINAADPCDIVEVAPGTYLEQIDFKGKQITVRSTGGPNVTTIDAGGSGRVVTADSGELFVTVLDGFTITGGNDPPDGLGGAGMLIDNSSPTVKNCIFEFNTADQGPGGGMYVLAGILSPKVTNCTFRNNTVTGFGGGGMCNNGSSPIVSNCTFTNNSADDGGGMGNRNMSNPTVTNCLFGDNTATTGGGGGMYNNASSPIVSTCTFTNNSAVNGGGMANNNGSNPTVTDCLFFNDNTATDGGGGMYNDGSSPIVSNCTFTNNSGGYGGGMANNNAGSPEVSASTFTGNIALFAGPERKGGGMANFAGSNPTVTNCTFRANDGAGFGGGMYNNGSSPTVTNCDFLDNFAVYAGGMCNADDEEMPPNGSSPEIINCTFTGNMASFGGSGGAMANVGSNTAPMLTNCIFSGNSAILEGGEIGEIESKGGAIRIQSGATVIATHCTFSGNQAYGDGGGLSLSNDASATLHNCTFWGNKDDMDGDQGGPFLDESAQIHSPGGATIEVRHSDIMDDDPASVPFGGAANGNIDVDPTFFRDPDDGGDGFGDDPTTPMIDESANDDFGDLHISGFSPCIDAADNTKVPADVADLDADFDFDERTPLDLDGNPRFFDDPETPNTGVEDPGPPPIPEIADMGAYEFQGCPAGADPCAPDLNDDTVVDPRDLAALLSAWGPNAGHPADFDCTTVVDTIDLDHLLGAWGPCP